MIFYFSGTGNSAWVARQLAESQQDELYAISEEIVKNKQYECQKGEAVGFVFPVYAWGPPAIVLRFMHQLQMNRPAYLYFVCTCGDDTGLTARVFSAAVRAKKWSLDAGFSVTMPNTYVSLPGFDVDPSDEEERKVTNAMARVRFIGEEVKAKVRTKKFDCYEGAMPSVKTYFLRPLFHAFLMSPNSFHATDACTACGHCEKVCPTHNIQLVDKRPQWGNNCTHCLACYHACPFHALHYGKSTSHKGQYKATFLPGKGKRNV